MSEGTMREILASEWSTPRCWVRDSIAGEEVELARLYNSCTALGAVDPTFMGASEAVVRDLIDSSEHAQGGFRMQTISIAGSQERIGYFHLTHKHPQPHTTWLSIFVLGIDYQKNGYGWEVAEELMRRLGCLEWCEEIWLKVYMGNHRALRHWIKMGFRTIVEVRAPEKESPGDVGSLVLSYRCR